MKIFIKLGMNTECHSYDYYMGIYKSIEEAIAAELERLCWVEDVAYLTYTHKDEEEDYYEYPHTHIVFFNKKFGVPSEEELIEALDHYDEDEFYDTNYAVVSSIVLQEEQI